MNYYPFHIGDYASATRHLSWEEDCAFRRLLDVYYTTEKPLPTDMRAVYRLVIAATDAHRAAVETVLQEFFERTDAGWINKRADEEIAAMRVKQQKQRDKANKRWNKPGAEPGIASAMPRHGETDAAASKADADAMPPTPTPTPTPKNHSGSEARAARQPRASRKCPEGFVVTDEMREWARIEAPGVDVDRQTAKFQDHTFKGTHSDWPATWRNWIREAFDRAPLRAAKPAAQASFRERDAELAASRVAEFSGRVAAKPVRREALDEVFDVTPGLLG